MPLTTYKLDHFTGLHTASDSLIPEKSLAAAHNCYTDNVGAITKRKGFARFQDAVMEAGGVMTGLWRYRKASGLAQFLAVCGSGLYKADNPFAGTWTQVAGVDIEKNVPVGMTQFGDVLYFGTPNSGPFRYDGSTAASAGCPAPTERLALMGSVMPVASLDAGDYRWVMTYVYGTYGESAGSPASDVSTQSGSSGQYLSLPASVPTGVTAIRIYRTEADGEGIYYRVTGFGDVDPVAFPTTVVSLDEIAVTAGVPDYPWFFDHIADADLGEELDDMAKGLPPRGDLFAVYQSRLFISSTQTDTVYFSDLDFPDVFPAGNWIRAYTGENDPCVAIVPFGSVLVMFKRSGIAVLSGSGPDTFSVRAVEGAAGCVAGRSVAESDGGLLYLGRDGVYLFNGVSSRCVTKAVRGVFEGVNHAALDGAAGVVWHRAYWLSYPAGNSATNASYLRFDLDRGTWSEGSRLTASCFCVWNAVNDKDYLWFGSPTAGYVYLAGVRNYDITAAGITAYFQTQDMDLGAPDVHKEFRKLWIEGESLTDLTISFELDSVAPPNDLTFEGAGTDVWDTAVFGVAKWADSVESTQAFRFPAGSVGRRLRISVASGDNTVPWTVRSLTIAYEPKRRWT